MSHTLTGDSLRCLPSDMFIICHHGRALMREVKTHATRARVLGHEFRMREHERARLQHVPAGTGSACFSETRGGG